MSLSPDRLDHFWHLLNDPRYAHGANLVPIPMPRGAVAELLNDAKEVERLRAKLARIEAEASESAPRSFNSDQEYGYEHAMDWVRTALEDQ